MPNNHYHDISATGVKLTVFASYTFPTGFEISEFPADTDPFDSGNIDIAAVAKGINGDVISNLTPATIPFDVSVIPGSEADKNLETLLRVNFINASKIAVHDIVTIVVSYPNGDKVTLLDGSMINGPALKSANSDAAYKTRTYGFMFGNVI